MIRVLNAVRLTGGYRKHSSCSPACWYHSWTSALWTLTQQSSNTASSPAQIWTSNSVHVDHFKLYQEVHSVYFSLVETLVLFSYWWNFTLNEVIHYGKSQRYFLLSRMIMWSHRICHVTVGPHLVGGELSAGGCQGRQQWPSCGRVCTQVRKLDIQWCISCSHFSSLGCL